MKAKLNLLEGPYAGHTLNVNESLHAVPDEIYVSKSEQVDPGSVLYTTEYPQTGDSIYRRVNQHMAIHPENIQYEYVRNVGR